MGRVSGSLQQAERLREQRRKAGVGQEVLKSAGQVRGDESRERTASGLITFSLISTT